MQESAQYLGLATNPAERIWLPAERIAAFLTGSKTARAAGAGRPVGAGE
jgi:hypothetical protein